MYSFKFSIILVCLFNFVTIESLNITTAFELSENGLLRELADFIEDNSEFNSAGQCISDVLFWKKNFLSFEPWALSMFDAGGKLPSGLLSGNINSLGQFDQCLRVKYEDTDRYIEGKYCLVKLPVTSAFIEENLNALNLNFIEPHQRMANNDRYYRSVINWAACIPSTCNTSEIRDIIDRFWTFIGVDLDVALVTIPENMCTTNEKPTWNTIDWIALAFFVSFAATILFSTCYDLCVHFIVKDQPRHHNVFASFSLYTNTARLMSINKSSSSLRCLHGIRVMSMFWVILGHRYGTTTNFPLQNGVDIIRWSQTFACMMVLTGNLAVDTFFTLSGFLLSYVFFKQHANKKSFNVVLFYFHRFLRLTPALVAIVILQGTIFQYLGTGPLWELTQGTIVKPCVDNWWRTLLYLQNYFTKYPSCVSQSWYLAVDMHLYVLSPILIYPLLKNKKIGITNMIFWTLVSQITVIAIVYSNNWAGTAISFIWDQSGYYQKYYYATHTRAVPWFLGFVVGYAVNNTAKKEIKLNKVLVAFLWISSLAIMAAVIFGVKPIQSIYHEVTNLQDGTYNAFARTAWAISLLWIIFACVHGYGGPINWFLSWSAWEILGRLSYSMYLTHVAIQYWMTFLSRTVLEFSHFSIFYTFFGDLVLTICISYLWAMAFESPFMVLEKSIFHKKKPIVKTLDEPKSDAIIESDLNPVQEINHEKRS